MNTLSHPSHLETGFSHCCFNEAWDFKNTPGVGQKGGRRTGSALWPEAPLRRVSRKARVMRVLVTLAFFGQTFRGALSFFVFGEENWVPSVCLFGSVVFCQVQSRADRHGCIAHAFDQEVPLSPCSPFEVWVSATKTSLRQALR